MTGPFDRNGFSALAAIGDRLVFAADALGSQDTTLWATSGVPGDLEPLLDLPVTNAREAGDRLFFAALDDATGWEPWTTNGTVAGTFALADLRPGPESSHPSGFRHAGDRVYFQADDGVHDVELWAQDLESNEPPPPPPPNDPPPPPGAWLASPEVAGFRFKVRITAAGEGRAGRLDPICIPETACVSGAIPGRSELFVRVVGPKPNGRLWPTLVRFSTSTLEVWIEQLPAGDVRYYRLEGATPGSSSLDGLFDRDGFPPFAAATSPPGR